MSAAACHPEIKEWERPWVELQPEFERLGFRFRPRFRPGWVPSWDHVHDPDSRVSHEDSAFLRRPWIMDAVRIKDNSRVIIKMLDADDASARNEAWITTFLGQTERSACAPTVPVLETVILPRRPDLLFLVLPEMVPWDVGFFRRVDEILDLVRQLIFGLYYMHMNHIAHGDIGTGNIVMDGFHLFEDEPHPSDAYMRIDFAGDTQLRPRHTALPSYHFIDFGLSTYNPPGTAKILYRGVYGQDVSVPEFQDDQVVDPFKADLWSMGRFLQVYIANAYCGVDMLRPLIRALMQVDADERLSAKDAYAHISRIINTLSRAELTSPVSQIRGYWIPDVLQNERLKAGMSYFDL